MNKPFIFIISVAGIFIPETRRYYLTSHSGLWRICRYSLVPTILANSSAARNFTTLSLTNLTQINLLKKTESLEPYIQDALNDIELDDPITEINNEFRRVIYSQWITNNTIAFTNMKQVYKQLDLVRQENEQKQLILLQQQQQEHQQNSVQTTITKASRNGLMLINPTNVSAINETIGAALSTVHVNGTYINVIVPETLRNALFLDWEEKPNVLQLLWAFAKDMEISIAMTNSNGTRYIIQPPPPPKKGKVGNGYEYKSFRKYYKTYF